MGKFLVMTILLAGFLTGCAAEEPKSKYRSPSQKIQKADDLVFSHLIERKIRNA